MSFAVPALILLHTLEPADGNIVSLEDGGDGLSVLSENLEYERKDNILYTLYSD